MSLTTKTYLTVEWVLVGLCLLVIIIRFAVRTWKRMFSFWLSEFFLFLAFLSFLTLVVGDTYSFQKDGAGFSSYDDAASYHWLYAANIVFDLGFYFPRFSLLAFYNELFPISEQGLRRWLYCIAAYNVAAFLTTAFIDLFWCGVDVDENWEAEPTCALGVTSLYVNWFMGIIAELLVFGLPFGMLRSLKSISKREKIALISIFAIGALSIIASVTRLTLSVLKSSNFTTYLVGSAEVATQIIVVALPALRPLLPAISRSLAGYLGGSSRRTEETSIEGLGVSSTTGQNSRTTGWAESQENMIDLADLSATHWSRDKKGLGSEDYAQISR